jgi:biopolymer transport protein ExbD
MRRNLGIAGVAFLLATAGMAHAQSALSIKVLSDGNVRIGPGPELDRDQFRVGIKRIAELNPQPNLSMKLPNPVDFQVFANVIQAMQDSGYKIGFVTGPPQP